MRAAEDWIAMLDRDLGLPGRRGEGRVSWPAAGTALTDPLQSHR